MSSRNEIASSQPENGTRFIVGATNSCRCTIERAVLACHKHVVYDIINFASINNLTTGYEEAHGGA